MRSLALHLPLLPIVLVALLLRLYGQNWDDGFHLHPDERFIAIVSAKITLPDSVGAYFDTARSPLNPYNNGFDGFAYGMLPLFAGRWLAELTHSAGYDQIVPLGRTLSALSDVGSLVFAYALGSLIYGRRAGLLAAALLAGGVLGIQLSHFYAFDTFTTFFTTWALYFAYRCWKLGGWQNQVLLGIGIGCAVASKISSVTFAPVAVLALVLPWPGRRWAGLSELAGNLATVALAALLTYRVAEPYAFVGTSFFDLRPNPKFIADKLNWIKISSGDVEVPYMIQWARTGKYGFVLDSIVRWGLGPAAGLAALVGLVAAAISLRRWTTHGRHLLVLVWALVNLAYFGGQFAKFMRYLLPVYPALALLGALALDRLLAAGLAHWQARNFSGRLLGRLAVVVPAGVLLATFAWALAFVQIYAEPNTRVAASRWMVENLPRGTALGLEHWDDGLPLAIPGYESGRFRDVGMNLYDDDNPDKLRKLQENLNRVDYLVLASNRLYGSIPRLPERYPLATEYYRALFDGRLGFELAAEFTSRPVLFGVEIDDDRAQEDFTVYDHPKVQLFRKVAGYNAGQVAALFGAVTLDNVQRVKPVEAGQQGQAPLLSDAEWARAQTGGTWSALFDRDSLANRLPLLIWWLAAALCGLAAWPLLWRLTPHLAEGGFGLARTFGLLVIAYAAWLLASLKLVAFGRPSLLIGLVGLVALSALAVRGRGSEFRRYLARSWPAIAGSEVAFTIGFLVCLAMRLVNPDLWHPNFGGEKPMDFAYLNAVVKSDFFPPYDPWFAGGSINYYYFGFVLVAAVVKLTGIVPAVAYNLALPLWFGLLSQTAFSVGYNLALPRAARGLPRERLALAAGGVAAVFVTLIGNLDGAGQIRDALWKAGGSGFQSGIPILAGLVRAVAGLLAIGRSGALSEFDFWRSTRVIGPEEPGPITEFPFFSFLYGDLHAHLLALPLTVLALGLSLELVRSRELRAVLRPPWRPGRLLHPALGRLVALLLLLGLVIGALRATNTWDFPTYLAVAALALCCLFRPLDLRLRPAAPLAVVLAAGFVFLTSSLLFGPYLARYQLFYSGVAPSPARTAAAQFLVVNGFWIFLVGSYLVLESARGLGRRLGLGAAGRPAGYYSLALPLPFGGPLDSSWGAGAAIVLLVALAAWVVGLGTFGLLVALGCWAAALAWQRWRSPNTLFKLALALLALGVLALPEAIAVKGDVGRMNTVFKFYLQAWVLLAIVGAVWLTRLASQTRLRWGRTLSWRPLWLGATGLLVACVLVYPLRGGPTKLALRFQRLPPTLDGMGYMAGAAYRDRDRDVDIPADYPALLWLQEHVEGSPVVLEANTGLYKWGSRVSVYTGLPSIIGWDWHQKQQRVPMAQRIDDRLRDVRTIYETPRLEQALPLLRKYGVGYVYIGGLERIYYPPAGLKKFEEAPREVLEVVYQNPTVTILRVVPPA